MKAWYVWKDLVLTLMTWMPSCVGRKCYLSSCFHYCDIKWVLPDEYKHCTEVKLSGHSSRCPTGDTFLLLNKPYIPSTDDDHHKFSSKGEWPSSTAAVQDSSPGYTTTGATTAQTSVTSTEDFTGAYNIFHIVTDNNTLVTSPNFPSNYGNSLSIWVSIRPPDKLSRVSLTFVAFDIEYSANCTSDSVLILGIKDTCPICGHKAPSTVVSLGNIMEIYFKTDSKTTSTGFEAVIQFLDPDPDYRTPGPGICGSIYVRPDSSTVLDTPSGGYRNIQCGYIIHADIGKTIVLSFRWIHLETCTSRANNFDFEPLLSSYDIPEVILGVEHEIEVESCPCESVQIFDGFDGRAPNLTDRLCGYEIPTVTPSSTGNVMYIYLETDNDVRIGQFGALLSVT